MLCASASRIAPLSMAVGWQEYDGNFYGNGQTFIWTVQDGAAGSDKREVIKHGWTRSESRTSEALLATPQRRRHVV